VRSNFLEFDGPRPEKTMTEQREWLSAVEIDAKCLALLKSKPFVQNRLSQLARLSIELANRSPHVAGLGGVEAMLEGVL
jgi:hypothetical protein